MSETASLWADDELALIPQELRRRLVTRSCGADAAIDGVINFTSNNYLSLARHPHVIERAKEALIEDGAGAGSSRLITGTSPRITILEEKLAEMKGASRALVTSSGYAAAQAAITTLVGRSDGIALERGAHASLVAGARLSRAKISVFRRSDPDTLEKALKRLGGRSLVIVDGIHSMDGDIVHLPDLLPMIEHHHAMLLIDDAHATGVLGGGTLAHFGISPTANMIQMGTLSKALGSQGGFIAASSSVIDLMIQRAAAFIYTTALNPAAVGAAIGAIEVISREPDRIMRLRENSRKLRRLLGVEASVSPIIPLIYGEPSEAIKAARDFETAGALALAIRPPTVPKGTSRLRLSVQADHQITGSEKYLALRR